MTSRTQAYGGAPNKTKTAFPPTEEKPFMTPPYRHDHDPGKTVDGGRLTCKNSKPDSPQRWLGSLRSPNQRFVQSPCGREVARAGDKNRCNQELQRKLRLARLAGSLRLSSIRPVSTVSYRIVQKDTVELLIIRYRLTRVRRWRVSLCFAEKKARPEPMIL